MDKKDEEANSSGNPYKNIEKASVLQEVFCFFENKNKYLKFFQIGSNIQ